MYEGGGIELYNELYQKELKLNVKPIPDMMSGPQAFGWFKKEFKSWEDFKGLKCRQTGIANEIWTRAGMRPVNMPGMHESVTVAELIINLDVWNKLPRDLQAIVESACMETYYRWGVWFDKFNAEGLKELREKHGVKIMKTPEDILYKFLETWDKLIVDESAKNPFFKKVIESQKKYASLLVPARRFMYPSYNFAADYYWPEK